MKSYFWQILTLGIIIALSGSCKKTSEQKARTPEKPKLQIVVISRDDSTASISEGWTLSSKGMLIHWKRYLDSGLFDENPVRVDSQKALNIIDSLKQTGILQTKIKASGNIVYHLRYKCDGRVTHISWDEKTSLPSAFVQWRKRTLAWCQKMKTQSKHPAR